MKTEENKITLATKKNILHEFIRLKETQLQQFSEAQQQRLDSSNKEDIDKGHPVESPKAQMMDEIELQAATLDHLKEDIDILKRIEVETPHDTVSFGSLLRTNRGYILVGVAHPEVHFEGRKVISISTKSPLFQKMEGFKAHTEFHMSDIEYVIFEII
jgi:hypothetical protein